MDSKHIERDFSAHRKNVIRPYDEFVKIEIFSFDPKYTKSYIREDNSLKAKSNATKTSWKSWSCFKSTDKQNVMVFELPYYTDSDGEYRIDLLYEQNNYIHDGKTNTSKDLLGHLKVDNLFDGNIKFDGENNILKRNTTFLDLDKGNHKVTVQVPHNCYFYGAIIRKVLTFVGDNYYGSSLGSEEGNLVLTTCTITNSDMTKPTELSADIFYDPDLVCEESESGFYIDYRDEVNFYVKNDDKEALESTWRVFGGYISSILPNSDLTKLSLHCADRLVDGQNKYLLDQMRLGGGATSLKESGYTKENSKDFDSYPKALKYLCDVHEVTLKSNISKDYTVDGETFHDGLILSYGSKKKIKKISATNGITTPSKNYIMIRNKSDSNRKQVFELYNAKSYAKKPPEITKYPYLHITYGLGKTKTSHQTKTSEKVDTSDTTAGSQKFTKCGVSEDGKYIMAIGKPSAGKDSVKGWTKTVFERKCPHCGSTNLVWDIGYGTWGYASCKGSNEGGGVEGHIFCKSCDADYSVQGYEHINGSKYHLKKVSSTVKSSEAEKNKLRSGKMVAVPSSSVEVTSDDVLDKITKIAFKYKYKLGAGSSSYASMKKTGFGDCWAFSDLIFTELKKYNVSCKIKQYDSGYASNHQSVIYKDANGKWVNFPYREKGWGTRYNNMLNNYPKNKPLTGGKTIKEHKGGNMGNVKAKTSTSKSQTTNVTHTKGYDKDKPFQGYLKLTYSLQQSFSAKKYSVDIKFTYNSTQKSSINTGLQLYWINNTVKKATLRLTNKRTLIDYLRSIHGENARIFVQSIQMIAPKIPIKKKDDGSTEDTSWYKNDKSTDDQSSCKLNLYQIVFNDNKDADPSDLQSCGKSVNSMIQQLTSDAGYNVDMTYGLHRKDDIINFRVVNQTKEKYTASEGDNNNILNWGSITYNPISSMFNMSTQVFKDASNNYHYIDTKNSQSILNYGEQCTLQTSNEAITEKEAYFNATQNDKYNPEQSYSYTITVPNCPLLKIGDLVKVVANAKKLNSVKEVKSLKITFDSGKIPRIQTEIGLDELAPNIQLKKNIRKLRSDAKHEDTKFSSSATPITQEIYYEWDR